MSNVTRIRMIWVLPMLLLALSFVAIWLVRTNAPAGYIADTGRNEIELWFGDNGLVLLDGQLFKRPTWKERWTRALEKSRGTPVRIGADEDVPYALVHEAYAESWQRGFHDAGYEFDPQGHFVALSELTRSDVTPRAGEPIVLEMNAQGQMAWLGIVINESQLCGAVRVVAANFPRVPYLALIGLKIDPQTPYGLVRRMLSTISKVPPYRVATFEERETTLHVWLPLPPLPRAEAHGDPAPAHRIPQEGLTRRGHGG